MIIDYRLSLQLITMTRHYSWMRRAPVRLMPQAAGAGAQMAVQPVRGERMVQAREAAARSECERRKAKSGRKAVAQRALA